ncbi:hypothetical protein E1193_21710, partial [Micromonospora sp. KC606]|uniref:cellulose binding domain-containing protein n=1 Tax=Micromonospora sp. KC606 TaxID=2530379 RepID=UPI0010DE9413
PPALAARYATVSTRVLGYTAEVVIDNPGGVAVDDWSLVVTLAPSATVGGVTGAQWRQEGQVVTFTGAAVPAGGSRSLRFDVRDADLLVKAPRSCAVDGTPCTGL